MLQQVQQEDKFIAVEGKTKKNSPSSDDGRGMLGARGETCRFSHAPEKIFCT